MLKITSTMIFSNDQSTNNDRLKPVMTTGLVNMHINRSIANLAPKGLGVCVNLIPIMLIYRHWVSMAYSEKLSEVWQ